MVDDQLTELFTATHADELLGEADRGREHRGVGCLVGHRLTLGQRESVDRCEERAARTDDDLGQLVECLGRVLRSRAVAPDRRRGWRRWRERPSDGSRGSGPGSVRVRVDGVEEVVVGSVVMAWRKAWSGPRPNAGKVSTTFIQQFIGRGAIRLEQCLTSSGPGVGSPIPR